MSNPRPQQAIRITARRLNRSLDPQRLPGDTARQLYDIVVGRLSGGRVVRRNGCARTQASPQTVTVGSSFDARTRSGDILNMVWSNGSIFMTPGNLQTQGQGQGAGAVNAPRNEWSDPANTSDDDGFDQALFRVISAALTLTAIQPGLSSGDVNAWKMQSNVAQPAAFPVGYPAPGLTWVGGIYANAAAARNGFIGRRSGMQSSGEVNNVPQGQSQAVTHSGTGGAGWWYWYFGGSMSPGGGFSISIKALRKLTFFYGTTLVNMNPGDTQVVWSAGHGPQWHSIQPG